MNCDVANSLIFILKLSKKKLVQGNFPFVSTVEDKC